MLAAAWGDSLTAGASFTPYPTALSNLNEGALTYNLGVSGETSAQVRTRFLADTTKHGYFTIIWVGHNDVADLSGVADDVADMVAALGHSNYLVMSMLNDEDQTVGTGNYNAIVALNAALAAAHPDNFLDIRTELVAAYDPNEAQDVLDHANDVPPTSLRTDHLHLNTAGYAVVAARVNAFLAAQ